MRKNQKFTPISIAAVKKICEEAGLLSAISEFAKGIVGDFESECSATIGYGLDKRTAADAPVVLIYEDNTFELNQDPHICKDTYRDGTTEIFYECGSQNNYIGSVERFKKFFDIALEKHKKVYEEYKRLVKHG